jgi:hypothetical protein
MSYSIAWEPTGTLIVYGGVVNFQDVMGAVFAIHQNPRYPEFKYAIHDMSRVEQFDYSAVDMTQIVAHEIGARYTNPSIGVVLVTTDAEMEKYVKVFSSMTKLAVRMLPTLDDARALFPAR